MEYIIDFQAFRKPMNDLVLKHLVIFDCDNHQLETFTFKPPFAWSILPIKYKVENKWLENHCIHHSWSSGDVEYNEVEIILMNLSKARKVYVNGMEKFQWLKKRLNNVCNIKDSVMINELGKTCLFRCNYHIGQKININYVICNVYKLYYLCNFFSDDL